jgi:uracil-DNA glycosylase
MHPACRRTVDPVGAAARFLGGSETILCHNTGTNGETWTFEEAEGTLLVRFPICPHHRQTAPPQYSEAYIRKLFLYIEFNTNFEALPEEIDQPCVFLHPQVDRTQTCCLLCLLGSYQAHYTENDAPLFGLLTCIVRHSSEQSVHHFLMF